jgi:hypothetical protein
VVLEQLLPAQTPTSFHPLEFPAQILPPSPLHSLLKHPPPRCTVLGYAPLPQQPVHPHCPRHEPFNAWFSDTSSLDPASLVRAAGLVWPLAFKPSRRGQRLSAGHQRPRCRWSG